MRVLDDLEGQGAPGAGAAALAGLKVLVVEDRPLDRALLEELLRGWGAEVVPAGDGGEALERMLGQSFDLVLMDVRMPILDGCQATRTLRAQAGWASLPILGVTTYDQPGERERCLAAGMSDCLIKPLEPGRLAAALRRWTGRPVADPAIPGTAALPGWLPGIDLEGLRRRLGGNDALARQMLDKFLEVYADAVARLDRHLAAGDLAAARHLVHDVKGAAGILEARGLAGAAADLEAELRAGVAEPTGVAPLRAAQIGRAHV
jgi:CheY-like chemotaxis protein/HPt (histidine-containing phosphotransfer) domain-containing protein